MQRRGGRRCREESRDGSLSPGRRQTESEQWDDLWWAERGVGDAEGLASPQCVTRPAGKSILGEALRNERRGSARMPTRLHQPRARCVLKVRRSSGHHVHPYRPAGRHAQMCQSDRSAEALGTKPHVPALPSVRLPRLGERRDLWSVSLANSMSPVARCDCCSSSLVRSPESWVSSSSTACSRSLRGLEFR